jgi:CubicO group peptidase (beta-lactamase class C family)
MKALKGFAQFADKTMKQWQVPGFAIAVVKEGELVYAKGFGYRDVEHQLPVTPETIFAIGSSSKAFTATGAGIMVDDKKLDWHTPIRKWLPTFELQDKFATERMSLADLLCHRSGLPRHDLLWYNTSASRAELVDRLKYLEPSKDFRTFWQYQNLMYVTAGYLAGHANGSTWEALVQERILDPLEMTSSNFSVEQSQERDNIALPYDIPDLKTGVREQVPFRNIDVVGPAGSINSSVLDMANWLIMNLSGGRFKDQQIIAEATLKELHSAQMPLVPEAMLYPPLETHPEIGQASYGFGWFVQNYRGHRWVHHGGNIDGFSAFVSLLPKDGIGFVVLTNLDGMGALPLTCHALDLLLGLEPLDWNGIWRDFYDTMLTGVDQANDQMLASRIPDTSPSHALEAYAGEYADPGYGDLTIEYRDSQLVGTYNGLEMTMQHQHYDVFLAKPKLMPTYLPVTFSVGIDGSVSAIAVPLAPGVKPIEFVRKPSLAPEPEGQPTPE